MWWKKLILMIFLLTKLFLKVWLEDNWSYYDWLCVDVVASICVDVTKDGNVPSNFPDDAVKTVPKTGSTDNVVSNVWANKTIMLPHLLNLLVTLLTLALLQRKKKITIMMMLVLRMKQRKICVSC